MKKIILALAFLMVGAGINTMVAQSVTNVFESSVEDDFDNVKAQKLFSDELSTSFIIWIKKEVKMHKHFTHTEQVLILEGSGVMTLGHDRFEVKAGDFITIPKGVAHGVKVTSEEPLKVLSVQAPEFFGKDRYFIE